MFKTIFVLLFAIGVIWNAFGAFYFLKMNRFIKSRCKKIILAVLCGPLTWICVMFEEMFTFIDKLVTDKSLKRFEDWLIK